jgi:hypothetical protein
VDLHLTVPMQRWIVLESADGSTNPILNMIIPFGVVKMRGEMLLCIEASIVVVFCQRLKVRIMMIPIFKQ